MKKHRIAALLLAMLMLASAVGCSDDEAEKKGTQAADGSAAETEAETSYANLPKVDMNGADMPIFISYAVESVADIYNGISKNEFGVEEQNAEAVNDARVERNNIVNEAFNCKITGYDYNVEVALDHHTVITDFLRNMQVSGTNDWVFMLLQGYCACQIAVEGYLTDLYSYEHLALSEPWWDQRANENLTIMDTLYYTTGDISTADNDATCTVLFNKQLAENYNIPSLYDTVKEGKWTLELLYSYAEMTSADLNGDGKWTADDRFGAMVWDDISMAVVNATGERCAQVDEEGKIILTLNNERIINALSDWVEFGKAKKVCHQYQRVQIDDSYPIQLFSNNQALFFMQRMQIIPKMRSMETDFGILPLPKYDEEQAEYYNTVSSWPSVFFCMPYGNADPTNASILAEALAYGGKELVTPAYYEKTLIGKSTRDEESAEMLDIIFESRVYDLGWYYQFGEYNQVVMNMFRLNGGGGKDFTSNYRAREEAAKTLVDEVNEAFAAVAQK